MNYQRLCIGLVIFTITSALGYFIPYPWYWIPTSVLYLSLVYWWIRTHCLAQGLTMHAAFFFALIACANLTVLLMWHVPIPAPELILAVSLAPLFEEYLFRGYLYDAVIGGTFRKIALTSLLFALWYLKNIFSNDPHVSYDVILVQALLVIGPFLGWLRARYHSLFPPIVAHSIYNTMAILGVWFTLPAILVVWFIWWTTAAVLKRYAERGKHEINHRQK